MNFTRKEKAALLLGNAPRPLWLKYYKTAHWKAKREQKLILAGWTCELCRRRRATQVHHKHYKSLFKEDIRRDLDAVCGRCHKVISK